MKWTIILLFLLSAACGKNGSSQENPNVSQTSLGLNMSVPNFESEVTQRKGMIIIPHSPEKGAIVSFESNFYLIDMNKSNQNTVQLVRKLFRHQVDVRPYDQNATGTYYRMKFLGKFNLDSIILQALHVL